MKHLWESEIKRGHIQHDSEETGIQAYCGLVAPARKFEKENRLIIRVGEEEIGKDELLRRISELEKRNGEEYILREIASETQIEITKGIIFIGHEIPTLTIAKNGTSFGFSSTLAYKDESTNYNRMIRDFEEIGFMNLKRASFCVMNELREN